MSLPAICLVGHQIGGVADTRQDISELKCADITGKIIGAASEAHKFLGNGLQEVIYQRALAYEMAQAGLAFAREIEQEKHYKDLPEPVGTRRADFVVEGVVLVELKAVSRPSQPA